MPFPEAQIAQEGGETLGRALRDQKRGVGREQDLLLRHAERDELGLGIGIPDRDAVRAGHHPSGERTVLRIADRTDAVRVDRGLRAVLFRPREQTRVVFQAPAARRVLQKAPAPRKQDLGAADLAKHGGQAEAGDAGETRAAGVAASVFRQRRDLHARLRFGERRADDVEEAFVAEIAEPVVPAHENVGGGAAQMERGWGGERLFVHPAVILRHPARPVTFDHDSAVAVPHRAARVRGGGEEGGDPVKERVRRGEREAAAAEVRGDGVRCLRFVEDAERALTAREDHGLRRGHGFKRGPGDPDEDVRRGAVFAGIRDGSGDGDERAACLFVDFRGLRFDLRLLGAAADDQDVGVRERFGKTGRDLEKAEGGIGTVRIEAAHGDDAAAGGIEAVFCEDGRGGDGGGEFLRVDAVDRRVDAVARDAVLVDEVVRDVVGDRHDALAPAGDAPPEGIDVEIEVRGRDKAELPAVTDVEGVPEKPADEGRDAGVGVDEVEMPVENQTLQAAVRAEDRAGAFGVEGQGDALHAGCRRLLRVNAAEGRERDVVPGSAEFPAELEDVRLRSADVHGHGYDQNFHIIQHSGGRQAAYLFPRPPAFFGPPGFFWLPDFGAGRGSFARSCRGFPFPGRPVAERSFPGRSVTGRFFAGRSSRARSFRGASFFCFPCRPGSWMPGEPERSSSRSRRPASVQ